MTHVPTIDLYTTPHCPHADAALTLLRTVTQQVVPAATVQHHVVADPQAPEAALLLGSPTIRIDGGDLEGLDAADQPLSCRAYDGAPLPPAWRIEAALLRAMAPKGWLFLCVANSARSQIAEGLARAMAPAGVTVWSAGSAPTRVRPEAVAVLEEIGIDISSHQSKAVGDIPASQVDLVITLCGEEECPLFLGQATRIHWGLDDPASVQGSDPARLDAFRRTRDALRTRFAAWLG